MPKSIAIRCPHCDVKLLLKSSRIIGRKARCHNCNEKFIIAVDEEPEESWFSEDAAGRYDDSAEHDDSGYESGGHHAGELDDYEESADPRIDEFDTDDSTDDEFTYNDADTETAYGLTDEHSNLPMPAPSRRKSKKPPPQPTIADVEEQPKRRKKKKKKRRSSYDGSGSSSWLVWMIGGMIGGAIGAAI